jgi:hypothetical protein
MAEIIETVELTTAEQSGWAVDYRLRREDGEELHAEVRCWDQARASAERANNEAALAAMADRGREAALAYADVVEPPSRRGAVLLSIWFDQTENGDLCHRVSYEKPGMPSAADTRDRP